MEIYNNNYWNSVSRSLGVSVLAVLLNGHALQAQIPFSTAPEKEATRNGNKQFEKENYAEAEAAYKKALDKKNNMPEANFNLGRCAIPTKAL
jgi:thioredoxin-like negative regulator of GroEL